MAVTIYRHSDSGAPALPSSSSYEGAGWYMDVLKACLVTGFGSKAAAGWSMVYEDTTANKRRMAISNGNGVLEMITRGSAGLGFVIWDSITTPGVGAAMDDTFADVMSDGVNGWKHEQVAAPGADSETWAGLYTTYFSTSYAAEIGWTVFADDKSAWILFHYPPEDARSEPTDPITKGNYQHPQIFIGAAKSPDLPRSHAGNFFIGYGGVGAGTATPTSGNHSNLDYLWGLRTPMDTVPSPGNNPEFDWLSFTTEQNKYIPNPYSSVRMSMPLTIYYNGADVPAPAGLGSSYTRYMFATLPGMAQFSRPDSGATLDFWGHWNNEFPPAVWNLEMRNIAGTDWMPWLIDNSYGYQFAVTANADWWT